MQLEERKKSEFVKYRELLGHIPYIIVIKKGTGVYSGLYEAYYPAFFRPEKDSIPFSGVGKTLREAVIDLELEFASYVLERIKKNNLDLPPSDYISLKELRAKRFLGDSVTLENAKPADVVFRELKERIKKANDKSSYE